MELNKTKRWIYYGSLISVICIFVLGSWWLYLVFRLATRLSELNIPELKGNLVYMVQWEGLSFFVLLFLITSAHVYMFLLDRKKTRAISAFFASMGHELKTPLTSIRLQGQVIAELTSKFPNSDTLTPYLDRLKEDTTRLENELEKSLQLSRLEIGGNLNLVENDLSQLIHRTISNYDIESSIVCDENIYVIADEQALTTILKNLIENSIRHNEADPYSKIHVTTSSAEVLIQYSDNATFKGDINKLGQLFYKHNSPKGTGVGLYLVKKLCHRMNGSFNVILDDKSLLFSITFPKGSGYE